MSDISKRLNDMIEWIDGEAKVTPDSMIDLLEDSRNEISDLTTRLAAAEADAERLLWLLHIGIDKIGETDLHETAGIYASSLGRDEPNKFDYIAAIRDAIDKARGAGDE